LNGTDALTVYAVMVTITCVALLALVYFLNLARLQADEMVEMYRHAMTYEQSRSMREYPAFSTELSTTQAQLADASRQLHVLRQQG